LSPSGSAAATAGCCAATEPTARGRSARPTCDAFTQESGTAPVVDRRTAWHSRRAASARREDAVARRGDCERLGDCNRLRCSALDGVVEGADELAQAGIRRLAAAGRAPGVA